MPRLAPLARLKLKKHRRVIESFLGPLLRNPVRNRTEDNEEISTCYNMLQLLQQEGVSPDILLDTFISIIPGAMSIGPTVDHLFKCFMENLDVLNETQQEQFSSVSTYGDEISYRCLSEMKYLDIALKETLRLEFTLASYRYVNEDLRLHDGYVLPAGSHFILTGAAVNYDESIFPDSHTWNPKRWIEFGDHDKGMKANDTRRMDAFIWGSGKVFCAGRQHALIGMKMVSALVLRNFSIHHDGVNYRFSLKCLEQNRLFHS